MFRLPTINHPTDSGKKQQIADFLFQFIRQLNMEQNSAEGTVNASPTTNEAIQPVDYVVEQGTSGIWTYRKWASGLSECWCEVTYTGLTQNRVSGALHFVQFEFNNNFPQGLFIEKPKTFAHDDNMYGCWVNTRDTTSEGIGMIVVWGAEVSVCPHYVNIYATGKWK